MIVLRLKVIFQIIYAYASVTVGTRLDRLGPRLKHE